MKVFTVDTAMGWCAGLLVIVANDREEARRLAEEYIDENEEIECVYEVCLDEATVVTSLMSGE